MTAKRATCVAPLVLGMMWMSLAGCGRNDLVRSCTASEDCAEGFVCLQGQCVDSTVNPPDNDMTDMTPDVSDMDMGPPVQCTETSECPGGGDRVARGDSCVKYECANDACVVGTSISLSCGPMERQIGCECVQVGCQSQPECGDLACVDEKCVPCSADEQCDSGICSADGRCIDCRQEEDCRANEICDIDANKCVPRPECILDSDCDAQETCLNGRCTFSPECISDAECRQGYECIGGRCFEALCRGPEDCEMGKLCDAGECVDPPVEKVVRCFVATPDTTMAPGQTLDLSAFALDQDGNGVVATFSWTTTDASVASVVGSKVTAGNTAGTSDMVATLNGSNPPITCEGVVKVINVGPPPNAGSLRILVIDAETGRGVPGAEVVVGGQRVMSNSVGVASLNRPRGAFDVSVFSQPHNYVSVLDVNSGDVRIPLNPRDGAGPISGFTGTFDTSSLTTNGDVTLGLAGASISGGLINFDLSRLLGDPFVRSVAIPGQGGADLPLPGGLVLFGRVFGLNLQIKPDYLAKSASGARLAWGLAGRVPVLELIQLFQGGGAGGDLGEVLGTLLPLFNRFDHGLKPLNLQEFMRVRDSVDFDGDGNTNEMLPDYQSFPMTQIKPSVPQQLVTAIDVSNLPTVGNGQAELAILVGGTELQAPGFVPLGISATTDDDGDGRPDVRRLTFSPPYGAAVGGRFSVMAIAVQLDGFGATPGGGLELPDEFSVALWNGQTLPTSIQMGTFPNASNASIRDANRTITLNAKAGPLYRARFEGARRSWDVWSAGPAGQAGNFNHSFRVPNVPTGRADLFRQSNRVFLDAIRTQVRLSDLLKPSGVFLSNVALVSTGYNRTRIR